MTMPRLTKHGMRLNPILNFKKYLAYLDQLRNDDAKADKAWNEAESDLELYNESN